MSDRYITDLYLHAQPLVAMMFLFAIVTTVEVCVRRLDKQYLIVAVALIAMTLTYWFTILIMMAGA